MNVTKLKKQNSILELSSPVTPYAKGFIVKDRGGAQNLLLYFAGSTCIYIYGRKPRKRSYIMVLSG